MEAEIKVGARIDFLTRDELDEVMAHHMGPLVALLSASEAPLLRDIEGQGASGAATTVAVIDMGICPTGRYWMIRRWAVTGQDANAPVTGKCFIYCTAGIDVNAPTFGPADLRDFTSTIPDVGDWSSDQIIVTQGEHVIFRFTGLPNSTNVFANMTVEERSVKQDPSSVQAAPAQKSR